jgi:hypothetical protein
LYQKINQADDGLFGFMFQPRGKVIGPLRSGTIKLSGLPTSFTVYQQENEKTLVDSSIFEDFSIEARDVMEHGLNNPITQDEYRCKLVLYIPCKTEAAHWLDVHFNDVAYINTRWRKQTRDKASYELCVTLMPYMRFPYRTI